MMVTLPPRLQNISNYEVLKEEYLNGTSLTKLQKKYGVDRKVLSARFKMEGIDTSKTRPSKYTEQFKEQICELFLGDMTIKAIANELITDPKLVSKVLKEKKLFVSPKTYSYNESFFAAIDTEEKAYWLGFLCADGSVETLDRNVVELSLNSIDIGHINKFRDVLSPDKSITVEEITLGERTFQRARYQAFNKKLALDLESLGCSPRKSLTLNFPSDEKIPLKLKRHFVRGYLDGDGSIGLYTRPGKTKVSYSAHLSFLGTLEFLDGLQDFFEQEIDGYTRVKVQSKKKTKAFSIEKGGNKSVLSILNYLYEDATILLERKYEKYQEIQAIFAV